MQAKQFLNELDKEAIVAAIREAEQKTSGEIRVFVSGKKPRDAMATAKRRFIKLGMDQTRQHNAVLIYVAPRSQRFAIVGDSGVHRRCGDAFWSALSTEMSGHFRKGDFTQGIIHVVRRAGDLLAQHFPRQADDKNELPDEVLGD